MADINKLIPLIFKWEGGYVNDPLDLGGPTNMGVTLKTWQSLGYDINGDEKIDVEDLKLLTKQEVIDRVLRPYWNRWQADLIRNQSIANILVDWLWGSGMYGIKIPQRILGVKADGIVGRETLRAVNGFEDQRLLFSRIMEERIAYIERICVARPANNRFKKGWLNRLKDFRFLCLPALVLCLCLSACGSLVPQRESLSESRLQSEMYRQGEVSEKLYSEILKTADSELREEEDVIEYTHTVRYRPSSPGDTASNQAVSETVNRLVLKTNRKQQENGEAQTIREISELFTNEAQSLITDEKTKEEAKQQPGKTPWSRWYLALVIAAIVAAAWGFRKLITKLQ